MQTASNLETSKKDNQLIINLKFLWYGPSRLLCHFVEIVSTRSQAKNMVHEVSDYKQIPQIGHSKKLKNMKASGKYRRYSD